MRADSTPVAALKALLESQGVEPADEELEAVSAFLQTVLRGLAEIERALPPETPPAGQALT